MRGVDNMALDEALLARARARNEGVVRVYSWSTPTLSFGRNQIARDAYDPTRAAALGVDIVRRPTGGRALLHHHEITYSVTAPIVPGASLREAYDEINSVLVEALDALFVMVEIAKPSHRAPPPGIAPCFDEPSSGELMLDGKKLVGSALYREGNAYLQHGSILIEDDQPLIAQIARVDLGEIPKAATLREHLGEVSLDEFANALFNIVTNRWDSSAELLAPDDDVFEMQRRLAPRYADDAWTWRR